MQTIKNYCAPFLLFSLTAPDSVEIRYQGKTFRINRAGGRDNLPFTYAFEADGHLDLVLNGETYELESPL